MRATSSSINGISAVSCHASTPEEARGTRMPPVTPVNSPSARAVRRGDHARPRPYIRPNPAQPMWYGMVSSPGCTHIPAVLTRASASHHGYRSGPLRCSASIEAVPHPADRLDRGLGCELVPEPTHAHLHHVAAGVEVEAPHVVQQLVAPAHVPPPAHQVGQEGELPFGQAHLPP